MEHYFFYRLVVLVVQSAYHANKQCGAVVLYKIPSLESLMSSCQSRPLQVVLNLSKIALPQHTLKVLQLFLFESLLRC